ncbi:14578_t:CDS:1, partial [Acaulospora morrowiae]
NAKTSMHSTKQIMEKALEEERKSKEYLKVRLEEVEKEVQSKKSEILDTKQEMEKALESVKEESEKSRVALENEIERLMAKKNKFMCF